MLILGFEGLILTASNRKAHSHQIVQCIVGNERAVIQFYFFNVINSAGTPTKVSDAFISDQLAVRKTL